MNELEDGSDGDDGDDIARFERQCAERARAHGLHLVNEQQDDGDFSDGGDICNQVACNMARNDDTGSELQQRCAQLQQKLARKEASLAQVRKDLDMLRSDGVPGDGNCEIKQRLIEVTKKNRRFQVSAETQKSRIQQLEAELRIPREEAKKQAEELTSQRYDAMLGDGEDWKNKFLQASNKLQETRQEIQELRVQTQRQKKALVKELGSEEPLERALAAADDPNAAGWKGRAAQITQLQRQNRELKDQLRRNEPVDVEEEAQRLPRKSCPADKDRAAVSLAAEKRREEFDKLQEEVERLRAEQADAKLKRDALKSRSSMLESQLRELKVHVQTLVQKSENDDELVSVLRRQVGRHGPSEPSVEDDGELDCLRQENEQLQGQLERQAQIVLQLKQKSLADKCDAGSMRLGPLAPETPTNAVVERVRFLEAENAKQSEHVKLLQRRLGDDETSSGRPFSAEASMNLKERLRLMGDRLAASERDNLALRQRGEEQRPSSSISCRSSSAGPRGVGPDVDQLLRQNEALKREVASLRRGSARDRIGSPCSSLGGGDH